MYWEFQSLDLSTENFGNILSLAFCLPNYHSICRRSYIFHIILSRNKDITKKDDLLCYLEHGTSKQNRKEAYAELEKCKKKSKKKGN